MKYLILAVLLTGCTNTVVVPCPKPSAVTAPAYQTDTIADTATASQKIQALAVDLNECKYYTQQLETVLKGYK